MFRKRKSKLGRVLLGIFSIISFSAMGVSKTNPLEEEVENMTAENFSGRRNKGNIISVSDQDILEFIENKLSENTPTVLSDSSASKNTNIKSIIALNVLDAGSFNNEDVSHNKLEIEYDHYIDYDGVTNYSILDSGEKNISIDKFPALVRSRIDEDINAYKNPKIELGIEEELEYENNKEHAVKIKHEWISPFKSFNSEI